MTAYALLILPTANRVYAQASPRLTRDQHRVDRAIVRDVLVARKPLSTRP